MSETTGTSPSDGAATAAKDLPGEGMVLLGTVVFWISVVAMVCAWFYPTTVHADFAAIEAGSDREVLNIGKLQNQMILVVCCATSAISGIVLYGTGGIIRQIARGAKISA